MATTARRARCCRPILSLAVAAYARAASEGVIFARILRRICFCPLQIASAIVVFAYLTTGIIFLSIDVVANACARDRHIRPRAQALATVARYCRPLSILYISIPLLFRPPSILVAFRLPRYFSGVFFLEVASPSAGKVTGICLIKNTKIKKN